MAGLWGGEGKRRFVLGAGKEGGKVSMANRGIGSTVH